jgi:hypothetical protein
MGTSWSQRRGFRRTRAGAGGVPAVGGRGGVLVPLVARSAVSPHLVSNPWDLLAITSTPETGPKALVSSWVCRATSGRHCKVQNDSFSRPSSSTTTSQLQQLHGSFLGGGHLVLTSLIAHTHTIALHCVWFLPFHTRGGSDRSPGAGHNRLPACPWRSGGSVVLPVSA